MTKGLDWWAQQYREVGRSPLTNIAWGVEEISTNSRKETAAGVGTSAEWMRWANSVTGHAPTRLISGVICA